MGIAAVSWLATHELPALKIAILRVVIALVPADVFAAWQRSIARLAGERSEASKGNAIFIFEYDGGRVVGDVVGERRVAAIVLRGTDGEATAIADAARASAVAVVAHAIRLLGPHGTRSLAQQAQSSSLSLPSSLLRPHTSQRCPERYGVSMAAASEFRWQGICHPAGDDAIFSTHFWGSTRRALGYSTQSARPTRKERRRQGPSLLRCSRQCAVA